MMKRVFIQPQKNNVMLFFSQNERSILFQKAQETLFPRPGLKLIIERGKLVKIIKNTNKNVSCLSNIKCSARHVSGGLKSTGFGVRHHLNLS